MKTPIFSATFFLICVVSLPSQIAYGKVYKWVNESGSTSFSDQVSPEEAKYRRETLSKQGQVIDVTEQEKTKAQQERERLLTELRKKQERIMQNQRAYDASLLRSYHSKDEMITEMKQKIQHVESQKKLIESELTQQQERLDTKQKQAATFERNAQTIPANLTEEIKGIQEEIQRTKNTITTNEALQKKIAAEYDTNIKRYLSLTQGDSPEPASDQNKISSIEEADALGLFRCENDHQCKKAWEIARDFVDKNSTTPPDVNNDKLVIHALPTKDYEFSLSISKIASKGNEDELFLDIHCHESSLGKELCESKKIQDLRAAFRPYVNERLSKVPTP
jgi:hypothetical protein